MTEIIKNMLNELTEAEHALNVITSKKNLAEASVLTPVIQEQLDAIDTEFAPVLDAAAKNVSQKRDAVKLAVLEHGDSVKSDSLHAVFNKGRASWDTKGIAGYAVAHPEVEAFKKTGNPTVTIRLVK